MTATLSVISVLSGVTAAASSLRYQTYAKEIETAAGILILGGFALVGFALPTVL
jgi:hypothetical protein